MKTKTYNRDRALNCINDALDALAEAEALLRASSDPEAKQWVADLAIVFDGLHDRLEELQPPAKASRSLGDYLAMLHRENSFREGN